MSERKHVQFADSLRRTQDKMMPNQVNMAAAVGRTPTQLGEADQREANMMDEQFPTADLQAKDPRDELMNAKLQLQQGSSVGYTPFGKLEAKDSDFKWLLEKEAAVERANMEAWFAKNFDYMSPAQKAYAKKIFPQFYDARRRLLKKQVENVFDIARIKLDGLEDFEDMKKQYLLDTGRLDLGPLQNILHPEEVNADGGKKRNRLRFQRGLANPWYVFGNMAEPMTYATRKTQINNFAERDENALWKTNASMGIRKTGFPPFEGRASNQSTDAWFKKMQEGLTTL